MQRIIVRPYILEDAEKLLNLQLTNREHFQKWSPVMRTEEFFTLKGQQNKIIESLNNRKKDKRYDFAIILTDSSSPTLIGEV
jgi:ribosomal-protein-alanine N-acetyltransferase